MKKLLIVLLILVIAFLVVFVFGDREAEEANIPEPTPTPELTSSPEASETPEAGEGTSQDVPQTHIVELSDDAFTPSSLTIKVGDTVQFVSTGTKNHWAASGVHPVHSICQGFDSKKPVASGDSYSYTFDEAKTCPMHDHLNPSVTGKIVVETR